MRTNELRLLGSMEVRVDGAPIPLPGAAERALLALLQLSPDRAVAATTPVDLLWLPHPSLRGGGNHVPHARVIAMSSSRAPPSLPTRRHQREPTETGHEA